MTRTTGIRTNKPDCRVFFCAIDPITITINHSEHSNTLYLDTMNDKSELYHFGEKIGAGQSMVHRGTIKETGKVVAIKVISNGGKNAKIYQSAIKEIAILKGLDHAGIVKIVDDYKMGGDIHLVLEYVNGGSLGDVAGKRSYSREDSLSVLKADEITRCMFSMLETLTYVHGLDLVHCDIKPENILYDEESSAFKLADFGSALKASVIQSTTLKFSTTPQYAPPEVLQSNPDFFDDSLITQKLDMWALAASLVELTTGQKVCESSATARLLKSGEWSFETHYLGSLSEEQVQMWLAVPEVVRSCLQRCLVCDPAKRSPASQLLSDPAVVGARALLERDLEVRGLRATVDELKVQVEPSLP